MRLEKILLLLACALALVLIAAAGLLIHRSALADARNVAAQRLAAAALAHDAQQEMREREVLLLTRQLAEDKGFVGYIAQSLQPNASGAIDTASIRDLLDERRGQLGIDVAMVLDSRGRTLVDTASYQPTQSDLAQHSAVSQTLSTLEPASGFLRGRERGMQVAVAPLLLGASSEGLLLAGKFIDDDFARRIGAIAGTDIALLTSTPSGPQVLAGTIDADLRKELAAVAVLRGWPAANIAADETAMLDIAGSRWLARASPAGKDAAAGSLIALLPGSAIDAFVAATDRTLWLWGGVLAALAVLLAALLWMVWLRPLDALARSAAGIAGGALEPVPAARSGGAGIAAIARALGRLVGELRETRDFEAYSADLLRQRTRSSETGPRAAAAISVDHGAAAQATAGSMLADRYEIYARVGAGQSGVVYRALDRRHGEIVALKLLGPAAIAGAEHANHIKELLRAGARVQHANVARIRDVGQVDGVTHIASDYVRGISLKDALSRTGRIPLYAALRVSREICAGLTAIHAVGTTHGALNPANIVLGASADTKLLDIGLVARPPGFDHHQPARPLHSDPTYLSPQQIVGQLANQYDDVYALGLILTEIFTARLPQPNGSASELCLARIEREATAPSRLWTEIPAPIETLLLRCLERDASRRLPNATAVLAELERCRP
jgi:hypothetical protein